LKFKITEEVVQLSNREVEIETLINACVVCLVASKTTGIISLDMPDTTITKEVDLYCQ